MVLEVIRAGWTLPGSRRLLLETLNFAERDIQRSILGTRITLVCHSLSLPSGGWITLWDADPHSEPVSWHIAGWPVTAHPLLWPHPEWVLLWPTSELLRGHYILLPEWWQASEARQRTPRHLLRRNSILWTRGISHHQVQVRYTLFYRNSLQC